MCGLIAVNQSDSATFCWLSLANSARVVLTSLSQLRGSSTLTTTICRFGPMISCTWSSVARAIGPFVPRPTTRMGLSCPVESRFCTMAGSALICRETTASIFMPG